jgi:hypothetical protein
MSIVTTQSPNLLEVQRGIKEKLSIKNDKESSFVVLEGLLG